MATLSTRERILQAGSRILEDEGVDGFTTRAVCDATGVTAPTLYHHFGSKDGLVEAIVGRAVEAFMARKRSARADDPVEDLRSGWNAWIGFALAHPTLFRLMSEAARTDPTIAADAYALMQQRITRVAEAGRLNCPPEQAALAIWAASSGVIALFDQGVDSAKVEATSTLLFDAVLKHLLR